MRMLNTKQDDVILNDVKSNDSKQIQSTIGKITREGNQNPRKYTSQSLQVSN